MKRRIVQVIAWSLVAGLQGFYGWICYQEGERRAIERYEYTLINLTTGETRNCMAEVKP